MKLQRFMKQLKIGDYFIIAFAFIASFIPMVVFAFQNFNIPSDSLLYAVIYIDGQEIDRLALGEDKQFVYTFTNYHGLVGDQYNVVEVDGDRVRVLEDNSPRQIGVDMGWISRPGQTIVVLPHRLLVRIVAVGGQIDDEIIIPF